jgi:hypothetical protein
MLAFMATADGEDAPSEKDKNLVEDLTLKLKECGGTIIPCADGALMDSVTVETKITVDHTKAELLANRTLRREVTKKIFTAMKKTGGNATADLVESSVMITSVQDTVSGVSAIGTHEYRQRDPCSTDLYSPSYAPL